MFLCNMFPNIVQQLIRNSCILFLRKAYRSSSFISTCVARPVDQREHFKVVCPRYSWFSMVFTYGYMNHEYTCYFSGWSERPYKCWLLKPTDVAKSQPEFSSLWTMLGMRWNGDIGNPIQIHQIQLLIGGKNSYLKATLGMRLYDV